MPRRPLSLVRVVGAAPLGALLLSALGSAGPAPGPSPAAPIRLKALFIRLTSFAPLAIARDEGYFRAQGLDVELVEIPGITEATPALLRGELDVVAGMVRIADINAIARGASLRLVADKGHSEPGPCASSALVAHTDFLRARNPDSPDHLKGARISTSPLSFAEYTIDRFVTSRGLKLSDLTTTRLQQSVAAESLARGALDFTILTEPDLSRTVRSKHAVLWKPVEEILPGAQLAVLAYGPTLVGQNREAGKRFMVAYLQGVRQYNLGKTPRNLDILVSATGLDRELLKEACWQPIRGDGKINVKSVIDFQRWAVKRGALDAVVPPERFWDPSFIDEANKILGPPAP